MGVDYREQYRPDQLEPFWPNEVIKMTVVVLCTLAVIMCLVALPVLLDMLGVPGVMHAEEPANPRGSTPVGIKPEWYFLAVYQYLKLMPTQLLGVSGKTLGVLSQGPAALLVVLLPFWYRRGAHRRPGAVYRGVVTLAIAAALVLTIWGGWPEQHVEGGGEQLATPARYVAEHPLFFILIGASLIVFFVLMAQERRAIRSILYPGDEPADRPADREDT